PGNQAMGSVTPTTANGLVFNVGSIDFHTTTGLVGAGYVFDGAVNGYDDDNPGKGTPNSTLDEDNPYGHFYNSNTSPVTFTYTFNIIASPPDGITSWGSAPAAFGGL